MRISIGVMSVLLGVMGWLVVGFGACDPGEPKAEPAAEKQKEEKPLPADAKAEGPAPEGVKPDGGPADQSEVAAEPGPPDTPTPEETGPEPNPNVGKIRWSATTAGVVKSIGLSPDEKTVYVSASALSAYDAEKGTVLWTLSTLGTDLSAPLVGKSGTVYVGSSNKRFYAISVAQKDIDWSVVLEEPAHLYAPASSKDGSQLYVVAGNTLHAFKGRGEKAWANQFVHPAGFVSAPTVANDGTIYVCGKDKTLVAVGSDGTKKWEKSVGSGETDFCRGPAIDVDGTIYVGGDRLYAFKPSGDIKWSKADYGTVTTGVVIHQTFLYFATFKGKLFKVNKSDGTPANILWESGITLTVTGDQQSSPTIGAGGIIYIGAGGTRPALKFLSPSNGRGLHNITASRHEFVGSPAIAKDGTLYIGNIEGAIFAVWTNSPGLANSPWPRITHDNQNSGAFK